MKTSFRAALLLAIAGICPSCKFLARQIVPHLERWGNGLTKREGRLEDGLQTGEWTYYYESGQRRAYGRYTDDHQTGPWISLLVRERRHRMERRVRRQRQAHRRMDIVDAAMNDLIRPTLYNALHEILLVHVRRTSEVRRTYDIVGPICETGDFLAKERPFPPLAPGDLLAVCHAGAYCFAMSSNYNGRLRPAEVLVDGENVHLIRQRQTYDHLLDGTC